MYLDNMNSAYWAVQVGLLTPLTFAQHRFNGRLSCGSPRLVALGIFGALTKLKSAANDLPYTSQVALGLFGPVSYTHLTLPTMAVV